MRNFQISIVSAMKISKQCLQTALASGGFCLSQTLYRGFAPGPPELSPPTKITGVPPLILPRFLKRKTVVNIVTFLPIYAVP